MESPLVYKEPYLIKAIINGLIATTILWSFWTPFLIFVAVPLVNNQLKMGVCQGIHATIVPGSVGNTVLGWVADNVIIPLQQSHMITRHQATRLFDELYKLIPPPQQTNPAANTLIQQDPTQILNTNWDMYSIMMVTTVVLIVGCISLAVYLTNQYNLDGWAIVRFNILMAVIIMAVEAMFFLGVATQYMPFSPTNIAQDVGTDSVNYLDSLLASGIPSMV